MLLSFNRCFYTIYNYVNIVNVFKAVIDYEFI